MFGEKNVFTMKSEYLRCEMQVGIIVPKQTDKCLLLLHGYNGSFKHMEDNFPLEAYAEENKMLIVSPSMNNGYYINKTDYGVNDFLLRELLPLIFKTYELKEELPMYIAGISMGGYGSLLIGATFASKFKKIISVSGAFIAHDVAIGNPQVVGLSADKDTFAYFTDTFAPFDTLEGDVHRNPIAAIVASNTEALPEIIMTCGTKDVLYERNTDALRLFDKHGVVYDWFPIEEGIHDYQCFDKGLRYAFERLEA